MKLETALEIIKEQAKYILEKSDWLDGKPVEEFIEEHNLEQNGDNVETYCIAGAWQIKEYNLDQTKLYITQVDQFGGEGEGDQYWYVFKINHPEHGEALIQYSGYYDSWNGTNWDGCEPNLVEAYEYTKVGYRPVKSK